MHQPNGNDLQRADTEWINRNGVHHYLWNARILLLCKNIGETTVQSPLDPLLCKDIHGAFLNKVVRPYIIQSSHMVTMFMGKQDCIQFHHICPKHLLPEIGPGINNNNLLLMLHKNGRTQPFVVFIIRHTPGTSATDDRHTLRRAGSQKSYFQLE